MNALSKLDWRAVQVPARMARLDRDHRGFPIPFLVLRNPDGKANFTINDSAKRQRCLERDLCAICGQSLFRARWFIGGPLCAFHERGAYLDTPTHDDCGHYALQVCPYLAAPRYTGRIDDKGFAWEAHPELTMLVDNTMIPERPELFVALMATGQTLVGNPLNPYVVPDRPYRKVEYWRHGRRLDKAEGDRLSAAAVRALDEPPQPSQRQIARPAS